MNISILGAGNVGGNLGARLSQAGFSVRFGVEGDQDPAGPAPQRGRARERGGAVDPLGDGRRPGSRLRPRRAERQVKGQKVVVFGGGSGVGLATAKLLASRGAEVVITGRDEGKLSAAARE